MISTSGQWRWRDIHGAAMALSTRFDREQAVCNLCDSRLGFVVTWLAALRRGCLQLLPPSGGNAELTAMLGGNPSACFVVDEPGSLKPDWPAGVDRVVLTEEINWNAVADADPEWCPDWDEAMICLFTSGSTGRPEPHYRTLRQLARGAELLGERLNEEITGGLEGIGRIVCSVPPQHMFGVEASVMLSLVHGVPVLDSRPMLPADVCAATESCESGVVWVATPLHLQALVRAGESIPNCRAAIVSTMPLSPSLATQAERRLAAPVLEIYGSTETGAIALRRPAVSQRWQPLPGVRIEPAKTGIQVTGMHFPSPALLGDHIELSEGGDFVLLGRHADFVKIGGRRASLAGLNLLLENLPGLTDGVFHMPSGERPNERLVLIHSGEPLDLASSQDWLRARLDPAFLPRAIIHVDRLPRTGTGKISRSALDEICRSWLARRGRT